MSTMRRPALAVLLLVEKNTSSGEGFGGAGFGAPIGTGVSSVSLTYSAVTIGRASPSTSTTNSSGRRSVICLPSRSTTVASTVRMSTPARNVGLGGGCCCGGGAGGGDCAAGVCPESADVAARTNKTSRRARIRASVDLHLSTKAHPHLEGPATARRRARYDQQMSVRE